MKSSKIEFGGSLLMGKRKSRRPLHYGRPQHVVLKAVSSANLLPHTNQINALLDKFSEKFSVRILACAVHEDHIHLSPIFNDRKNYARWARAVTGRLAQLIPGVKWKLRPYNRLATTDGGIKRLLKYIERNQQEADLITDAHRSLEAFGKVARRLFETPILQARF